MKTEETKIDGLLVITPDIFGDLRGFFAETYNRERYKANGISDEFVQDNLSRSAKGVLRGLHFQRRPHAQGKLVQVIVGGVLDVAVDIRHGSPTYGQWVSVELSADNKKQFWIPEGFAHGFLALEDDTIFSYKCTDVYVKDAEGALAWDDLSIAIDWQLDKYGIVNPIVSEKDQNNMVFSDLKNNFAYETTK